MEHKPAIPTHAFKRTDWFILLLVILVAACLRLADGGATTHFRYDQGTLSQLALEMAHGEAFHWLGIQSSAGVPNSPMTVYFLVLPYLISDNPLFVVLFIAVWNVLGVALLWGITHRYFGRWVALAAGLAYAINPFAVLYSRAIWAQDYHTPIILLAILFGLLGFAERKKWAQALCLPVLLIGVQIHFAAWTLVPFYGCFLWLGRKNISWRALGVSAILTVLVMLPFAIGLSQQPAGAGDRADTIIGLITRGLQMRPDAVLDITQLANGLSNADFAAATTGELINFRALWHLMGVLALVGAGLMLRPVWRWAAALVWFWAGLTMIIFIPVWTGSGVFIHYFIPSIPALSLLTAFGIVGIAQLLNQNKNPLITRLPFILYGLVAVILVHQVIWTLAGYPFRAETYIVTTTNRTSTPMQYMQAVRDELSQYEDVILLGANANESNYFIWEPMLYETTECVRDLLVNGGWVDVLPSRSFAAVVAPLRPLNEGFVVPERYQHDDPIVIPLRPEEDPYIVYPFEAAPEWTETPLTYVDVPAFENGVRLLGYYLQADLMQLMWQLPDTEGDVMQYFGHFLNAAGEKIGQRDAPFYFPQYWCANDRIVTSVFIELPAEVTTLRVGMYRLKDEGGTDDYAVVDEAGTPIGVWIDLALEVD